MHGVTRRLVILPPIFVGPTHSHDEVMFAGAASAFSTRIRSRTSLLTEASLIGHDARV